MTSLEIFDMRGLLVATIFSEMRSVGVQQALFNASPLASGKYNYRLRSSAGFEITRMLTVTR